MTEGSGGTPGPPPGYQEPQTPGVAVGPPGRRTLASLGGASVFVQATAPTPPPAIPVNSLWLNTTLGALEVWNGSAWVIQAFTGTELITAGTIAANLFVANIVVAGIVNGTTIKAASFIGGDYFGYSTANPTLDALVVSLIPGTATVADSVGNTALPGATVYGGVTTKWQAFSLGGNGLALAWYQMTTADMNGAWTLIGEIAPVFGAPVQGTNNGQGFIWGTSGTPEPTAINGALQILGLAAAPASVAGVAVVTATTNGDLETVNPTDNIVYGTQRLIVRTTTTITINLTTPINILNIPNVAARAYRVVIHIVYVGGATASAAIIGWDGSATVNTTMGTLRRARASTNVDIVSPVNQAGGLANFSLAFNANETETYEFDGVVNFSVAGSFNVRGQETTAGDTWAVAATSYIKLEPI